MRVHVTGGSGFLGSHVVPLLVAHGHKVFALTRSDAAASKVADRGATPVSGDLDDTRSIESAFRAGNCDALVNIASMGFGHAPAIVAAAETAGLKRVVVVSTTSIFTGLKASSKRIRADAEDRVRSSSLDWTIVRPTMIYGTPADRNMTQLLKLLRKSRVVPLPGGGYRLQQPVHVADLATAVVAALETDAAIGMEYDVAGPQPLTFRAIVEQSAAALGRRVVIVPLPLRPLVRAISLYEHVARYPRIKAEQLERLAEDKVFDIDAARRDLGYAPRTFEAGIRAEAAL